MGISLSKPGNETPSAPSSISLSKEVAKSGGKLGKAFTGLGWDVSDAGDLDLDALALLLGTDDKLLSDAHLAFFGNTTVLNGLVKHGGDNLTGVGEGDDEKIELDLANLPPEVAKVLIAVSIYQAKERKQSLDGVKGFFVRLVNSDGDVEIARFELDKVNPGDISIEFVELVRNGSEWDLNVLAKSDGRSLEELVQSYGFKG